MKKLIIILLVTLSLSKSATSQILGIDGTIVPEKIYNVSDGLYAKDSVTIGIADKGIAWQKLNVVLGKGITLSKDTLNIALPAVTQVPKSYQVLTASSSSVNTFTFTNVVAGYGNYLVFKNGVLLEPTIGYTTAGNVITIKSKMSPGDRIRYQPL